MCFEADNFLGQIIDALDGDSIVKVPGYAPKNAQACIYLTVPNECTTLRSECALFE